MAKGIAKNETLWVTYTDGEKPTHVITGNQLRNMYFLYSVSPDGEYKKIGKSPNPLTFNAVVAGGR